MKKIGLLPVLLISAFSLAQKNNNGIPISNDAWIKGIVNTGDTNGVKIKVLNYKPLQPGVKQQSFSLQVTDKMDSALRSYYTSKRNIEGLSLVIRTDSAAENDELYRFAGARIVALAPVKRTDGLLVVRTTFKFTRIQRFCGIRLQPGPPPGAAAVQNTAVNSGWICEQPVKEIIRRKEMRVIGFTPPNSNGLLKVRFEKIPAQIQAALNSSVSMKKLILVLPDRSALRYLEYKLWNVKVIPVPGSGQEVIFQADYIECLDGTWH